MSLRFVVLGASGDLAARYLLPALAQLYDTDRLPTDFEVIGLAQEPWDTETFRGRVAERLAEHAAGVPAPSRDALVARSIYLPTDVTDAGALAQALGSGTSPVVAYLALPPAVFGPATTALAGAALPAGSRVVVEKPFGTDLRSAQELNALLHASFPEEAVFRVDHFLGHQTVQNVLGLRFANRIFEPVWNSQHVEQVDLVWDETIALEGRAGYYDHAGALRDMIQNHLLQLLTLVAMESPITLSARDLRDRKVDVLRAVRRFEGHDVASHTVRGRYGTGEVGGRSVSAYVDSPGVDPARQTETFAAVRLFVDNWRWAGTPFLLRSGKALAADRREIVIRFKRVPHLAFGQHGAPSGNVLRFALDPDRLSLSVDINGAGDPFDLERVELERQLAPHSLSAYARLLVDVIDGDPTLSIRDDEAEESWRIVEPILDAWRHGPPPPEYPAGSQGPG